MASTTHDIYKSHASSGGRGRGEGEGIRDIAINKMGTEGQQVLMYMRTSPERLSPDEDTRLIRNLQTATYVACS